MKPPPSGSSGFFRLKNGGWLRLLLLVSLGGLVAWCFSPPAVEVSGCAAVRADGSCELDSSNPRSLVLYIKTSPTATVTPADRASVSAISTRPTDDGILVDITPQLNRSELVLIISSSLRFSRYHLRLHADSEVGWLREARHKSALQREQGLEAIALLEQHLGAPNETMTEETRALAMGQLAWMLRYFKTDYADAYRWFQRALRQDQRAGLGYQQVTDIVNLTDMLNRDLHRPQEAEELLYLNQAQFVRFPTLLAPWFIQMAMARRSRGDFRGALDYLARGEPPTRRYGNLYAYSSYGSITAETLTLLGRWREANQLLDEVLRLIPGQGATLCRHAGLLQDRTALSLSAWELRPAGSGAADPENARVLGKQALAILSKPPCDMPKMRAAAQLDMAHIAVLSESYAEAEQYLAQARQAMAQDSAELSPQGLELQARIAEGQHREADARVAYARILSRSASEPEDEADPYDFYYRALLGLAKTWEVDNPDRALSYYRAAEHHLDLRGMVLPVGSGQATYLGKHEPGVGQYLDFLLRLAQDKAVEQERLQEALYVIRNARTRGVRILALLSRIQGLNSAQFSEYYRVLADYEVKRREYEQLLVAAASAPTDLLARLVGDKTRVYGELNHLQERSLQVLSASGGELPDAVVRLPPGADPWSLPERGKSSYRPMRSGEVLLACHPAGAEWACLAASAERILAARVPAAAITTAAQPDVLAPRLLLPFAELLQSANQLSVIAYGELRQQDVHLLPFMGRPLSETLRVVYSLDLPMAAEAATASAPHLESPPAGAKKLAPSGTAAERPLAVFYIGSREHMPAARAAAPAIVAALGTSFRVLDQTVGSTTASGNNGNLLSGLLPRAALFGFIGHGQIEKSGGWRQGLRTAEQSELLVSDILALSKVPQAVVLFGCDTGLAAEETGGLEGLGPVQAFLARGSHWAVGAVRRVDEAVAAEFARHFFQSLVGDSDDPHTALLRADAALKAQAGPRQDAGYDAAAFRVFVP